MENETRPSLLVSYAFIKEFIKARTVYDYRDWAMDSGAFSAWTRGIKIDNKQYIEDCLELISKDTKLTEVFALDVIGDAKASIKNAEQAWEAGLRAIPTYHFGEPLEALEHMNKVYPKIAIGGVARKKKTFKAQFAAACFSRVWPARVHGFGFGSPDIIMAYPFHSTDATNWELGPCGFGRWAAFGDLSWKGSDQNLRAEVEFYLKLERQAQSRWVVEMAKIERECKPYEVYNQSSTYPKVELGIGSNWAVDPNSDGPKKSLGFPKVQLGIVAIASGPKRQAKAIATPAPTVRLAILPTGQEVKALKPKGVK